MSLSGLPFQQNNETVLSHIFLDTLVMKQQETLVVTSVTLMSIMFIVFTRSTHGRRSSNSEVTGSTPGCNALTQ